MTKMMYYPYLDIRDETWIKFALLYFDHIETIVPPLSEVLVSDTYQRILNETDLVHSCAKEDPYILELTSREVIHNLEIILKNEYICTSIFNVDPINLFIKWNTTSVYPYIHISEDKLNHQFIDYICNEVLLGYRDNRGLKVPREIGLYYLTVLSHTIGELQNSTCLTDSPSIENMVMNMRMMESSHTDYKNNLARKNNKEIILAKNTIELKVPVTLSQISLKEIMEYRNKKKQRIKSFNEELDYFYESINERKSPENFITYMDQSICEFRDEMCAIGTSGVSVGLGIWFGLNPENTDTLHYLNEGLSFKTLGPTLLTSRNWSDQTQTCYTKKMRTDLSELRKLDWSFHETLIL